MTSLFFAFVAGLVTLLNPCVLPLLPVIIGSALQENKYAPLALAAGLCISFTSFGIFILVFGFSLGFDPSNIRWYGAFLLLALGVFLLIPRAQRGFTNLMSPVSSGGNHLLDKISGSGLKGQFLVGLLLGLVWSPCVGPTLGVAIAAASQGESLFLSGMTFLIFSFGVSASLLALSYGSRASLNRRKNAFSTFSRWTKPLMGMVLIGVSLLILTGFDKVLETIILENSPMWLIQFTTAF